MKRDKQLFSVRGPSNNELKKIKRAEAPKINSGLLCLLKNFDKKYFHLSAYMKMTEE